MVNRITFKTWLGPVVLGVMICQAQVAKAQRSTETAASQADDAFGGAVGSETIGLYSDTDVRGFNPQQAGNIRVDDVYVDMITPFIPRMKHSYAVRVGFSALNYPLPAPSGIIAYRARHPGKEFNLALVASSGGYGGRALTADAEIPVNDHLGIATGVAWGESRTADGATGATWGYAFIPVVRLGEAEIKLIASGILTTHVESRPLITTTGPFLPPLPPARRYLGQDWALNEYQTFSNGIFIRSPLGDRFKIRGGVFHSAIHRRKNFTDIFAVQDATGLSRHLLLSDPKQISWSNSWEGMISWHHASGEVRHTFLADARGRRRHIESGGSQTSNLGLVELGKLDPEQEPTFLFGPVNVGTLTQTNLAVGYLGVWPGRGQVNLGLTRTRYRAQVRSAAGLTRSQAGEWLYNASAVASVSRHLAIYAGYVSGLEDSGVAPDNAANRAEQLPASSTSQLDAGVKLSIGQMRVILGAFQMKKPYFSFDAGNRYTKLGEMKLRGLEASASGYVTPRLLLVAGVLAMDPTVQAAPGVQGLLGQRPVLLPDFRARVDATYRVGDDGLFLLSTLYYDGKRAASAAPYAQLGGRQLFLPSHTTLDLGFRRNFTLHSHQASIRFLVMNVFNSKAWKPIASNTFQQDEVRRIAFWLMADF